MSSGAEARARLAVVPLFVCVLPWRCNLVALPQALPRALPRDGAAVVTSAAGRKEEAPGDRVSLAPPHTPPAQVTTLPEEVVVKVMGGGQAAFLRCWARAQRGDPLLDSTKVRLHIEIDASGKVTAVHSDSDSQALSRCLAVVARTLPFPAPGTPAVVDLPLIFR